VIFAEHAAAWRCGQAIMLPRLSVERAGKTFVASLAIEKRQDVTSAF
jgi:hypothetical protein